MATIFTDTLTGCSSAPDSLPSSSSPSSSSLSDPFCEFIIGHPFPSACHIVPQFECVISLVHHGRCTLSIHTCTALNCVPVQLFHTTDTVITTSVPTHQLHYW